MNEFKQHIPCFVDIDPPSPNLYEFETTEELLNLEIVQRYGKEKNFSHFALNENRLIEVSDNGYYWWVVGYIKYPNDVDLPKWEGPKYREKLPKK